MEGSKNIRFNFRATKQGTYPSPVRTEARQLSDNDKKCAKYDFIK